MRKYRIVFRRPAIIEIYRDGDFISSILCGKLTMKFIWKGLLFLLDPRNYKIKGE